MVKNIELSLDRAQSLVDYINDNPTRAYAFTKNFQMDLLKHTSQINYRQIKLEWISRST
jgi:hypothetical protein